MLSHNSRLTSQPGSSPIRGEMTYDSLRSGFCNPVLMTGSAYDNINLAIFRIIIPKLWALASPSISRAVGDTIDEQEAITYFDRFIQDSLLRPNQISGSIGRGTDPLCSFDYGQLTFSNRRITNQVSVSIADFEWQRKAGPFGMYLSPEGLCKFYSLLENGNTFLTENSKRQMKTPVSGTNNTAFGLGFNVMSSVTIGGRPRPMYGHNGVNLGGAQSLAVTIPELNIQVVLLTNTNIPGGVGTLQNALTSALQNSYR